MLVFFGFLLTIFFGFLLTFLIVPKMHPLGRLGASYVLGLGVLTLLMFFYSLAGHKFTLANTLVALLIPILILLLFTYKKIKLFGAGLRLIFPFRNLSKLEKFIVLAIGFLILYSLLCTLYWPVHSWDALTTYDWRAKLFFTTGGMKEAMATHSLFGYPLLTSLSHTWVYLLGGDNPSFIYTLFFISFIMMFYGELREFSPRMTCFIATLFLSTTPAILDHSTFAYTNFPYTVYFVMGTIYLYVWTVKQKGGYLALSALMVGLSTWTRSHEPFWLTNLIILILYSLWKRNFLAPVLYSSIFFSIQQPWKIFEKIMAIETYSTGEMINFGLVTLFGKINFSRVIEVLSYLFKTTIEPWILFFFLLGLIIIREGWGIFKIRRLLFPSLILTNLMLLIFGGYVFSFIYQEWRAISESAIRMTIFFPPLIIYYLGISGVIEGVIKK